MNRAATRPGRQSGFTLIELVVALVIIAMAATTITGLMSSIATRGAEAMQQTQAADIANAYLRDALSRPFSPPYALAHAGARDHFGNGIAGLGGYGVRVNAAQSNALPGIPLADCLLIVVDVTSPSGFAVNLRAFKTRRP